MPPIADNRNSSATARSQPAKGHTASPLPSPITPHDTTNTSGDNNTNGNSNSGRHILMDRFVTDQGAARECFQMEPCRHSRRMLRQAAMIVDSLEAWRPMERRQSAPTFPLQNRSATRRPSISSAIPPLDFDGPDEKKVTFELALTALNYQMVFEDILEDCDFFKAYPELSEDKNLVMVVLWDYQSRKFQPRRWPGPEEASEDIDSIEQAVLEQQTKLKACLARRRIQASAPKIEFLLPDRVRRRSSVLQKPMPAYAWINTLKIDPIEVLETLKHSGLTQLSRPPKTGAEFGDKSFYQDPQCGDVLVFSSDCLQFLHEHDFVEEGYLVCQDKSSCLAAHSVLPMLREEGDVVVVNPGAGWVVAHLAVLLHQHHGNVVAVSDHDDTDHAKMMTNLELVGVTKNVKVIRDQFTKLEKDNSRLKNVRAALVIADCSKSAITNIVQYIVTEGENMKVLSTMAEPADMEKHIVQLQLDHVSLLRHALKMPKMKAVAYLTRSLHEAENEAVVEKSIEFVNSLPTSTSLQPWIVIPPVLPFSAHDIAQQYGIDDRYVRFRPSDIMNGCFLVCLARKPEDPSSVISQAKSKGLLGKLSKPKKEAGDGERDDRAEKAASNGSFSSPRTHQRLSCGSRRKKLTTRRLSSPVRRHSTQACDPKIPEYRKVVFHPTPFK